MHNVFSPSSNVMTHIKEMTGLTVHYIPCNLHCTFLYHTVVHVCCLYVSVITVLSKL